MKANDVFLSELMKTEELTRLTRRGVRDSTAKTWPLLAIELTAVLLFFLQCLRGLFSTVFGAMYDAVFLHQGVFLAAATVALLVLSCLLPSILPAGLLRSPLARLFTAIGVFTGRIFLAPSEPQTTMFACLFSFACAGLYIGTVSDTPGFPFVRAVVVATVADMVLRTAGDTYDITLRQSWFPFQVFLSVGLAVASLFVYRARHCGASPRVNRALRSLNGFSFGAFLFVQVSLLAMPGAVARWSGVDYSYVVPTVLLCTVLPLILCDALSTAFSHPKMSFWIQFSFLITAAGGVTLGYLTRGVISLVGLSLAQVTLLLAFLLTYTLGQKEKYSSHPGRPVSIGLTVLVVLNVAWAFTFAYPYVGLRFFRHLGLPVFLSAMVMVVWPRVRSRVRFERVERPRFKLSIAHAGIAFAVLAVGTIFALPPRPSRVGENQSIRVGTYNIHYGYDGLWQHTLPEIAKTIEQSNVDIVFLQEVDACRITSYGVDTALWLARRLGMNIAFQPTMQKLTGIATLSRFPISRSEGRLLPSHDEPAAILLAKLRMGRGVLSTYSIWLGLTPAERKRQLKAALGFISQGPAILGGDMNVTVNDPQSEGDWRESQEYRGLMHYGFRDPFIEGNFFPALTEPALNPTKRLDYVWLRNVKGRGVDARVLTSRASDHRMVVVELALE
jgi:endonuclease/exonuclease/phosphatase family metal-dependent hydrolase